MSSWMSTSDGLALIHDFVRLLRAVGTDAANLALDLGDELALTLFEHLLEFVVPVTRGCRDRGRALRCLRHDANRSFRCPTRPFPVAGDLMIARPNARAVPIKPTHSQSRDTLNCRRPPRHRDESEERGTRRRERRVASLSAVSPVYAANYLEMNALHANHPSNRPSSEHRSLH